ncbi:MAG: AraC family transcriptional regulator [Blastochloris sp.]|nr:AraC family transcriptional regulator [Blastochloris sp.]
MLTPYIESYRIVCTRGEQIQHVNSRLFAGVGLQLVFKLAAVHTAYSVSVDSSSEASCFVVGPLEKPAVGTAAGSIHAIHVIFRPGMAGVFLRNPLDELANMALNLDDIYPNSPLHIAPLLSECPDDSARIAALEKQLVRCLAAGGDPDPVVQQAIWQIEQAHGAHSIRDLRIDVGVSERTLQRLFKQHCGVAPKTFSQLTRFWCALQLLEHGTSWTDIIMRTGYYDQSHFIREFKTFSLMTPSDYIGYPQQLRLTDTDAEVRTDHNAHPEIPPALIHLVR